MHGLVSAVGQWAAKTMARARKYNILATYKNVIIMVDTFLVTNFLGTQVISL